MSTAPRVSIITATYNQAGYLPQCLRSVQAQGFQDWEQIVVDDGSTDGTRELVAQVTDPRVRYVRQDNIGIARLAETYNHALSLARGEFVAILEGDDFWPPNALATLVDGMQPGTVLSYGLAGLATEDGQPTGETIPSPEGRVRLVGALRNEPIGSALLAMASAWGKTFTFPCAVLVRRSALQRIGGFQQPPGLPFVDHPTFLRLAALGPFAFEPTVVAYWRIHARSATRNRDEVAVTRRLVEHAASVLREEAPRLGLDDGQVRAALATWPDHLWAVQYEQAKSHAAGRRWAPARSDFAAVARHGPRALRWRAAGGWLLAVLHRPFPKHRARVPGPGRTV